MELRTVVHEAIKERQQVRKEGVRIQQRMALPDGEFAGDAAVERRGPPSRIIWCCLKPAAGELPEKSTQQPKPARQRDRGCATRSARSQYRSWSRNCSRNREYMQSIIEEQEASNEELQSANEEIQSANEELQSTNEELETAKEELQSTNEELATINEEHENRNQELMSRQQRPEQSAGQRGTGDRDPERRHAHPALHPDRKSAAQPDRCRCGQADQQHPAQCQRCLIWNSGCIR